MIKILYTSWPIVVSQHVSSLFFVIQYISKAETIVISRRKFRSNRMWIVVLGNLYSSALLMKIYRSMLNLTKRFSYSLRYPSEDDWAEENRRIDNDWDVQELPLILSIWIFLVNAEQIPKQHSNEDNDRENEDMCDDLNGNVPESLDSAQPFVLNLFVLTHKQIFEFTEDVLLLRYRCFLVGQSKVPSAEDFVTVEIRSIVNSLDERRPIRAKQTNRYDDEEDVVQDGHGKEVSVG